MGLINKSALNLGWNPGWWEPHFVVVAAVVAVVVVVVVVVFLFLSIIPKETYVYMHTWTHHAQTCIHLDMKEKRKKKKNTPFKTKKSNGDCLRSQSAEVKGQ